MSEAKKTAAAKGAKVPQDRKPKEETAESVEATRMVGDRELEGHDVTYRGITVFVPREALDDFELLEDISNLDQQKAYAMPSLLRRLIGDDFRKVMDGLRDKTTGRVAMEDGSEFVGQILGAINPS